MKRVLLIVCCFMFTVSLLLCQQFEKHNIYSSDSKAIISHDFTNNKLNKSDGFFYRPSIVYLSDSTKRHTYTYDSEGMVLCDLVEKKETNKWINDWCYQYTYDSNGNLSSCIYMEIDWDSNNLINEERTSYTYDSNGNLTRKLFESWEKYQEIWINSYQYIFNFDNNSNKIFQLWQYWNDSAWKDIDKYNYTYDNKNNILTENYEKFDNLSNLWVGQYFATNSYNGNNKLTCKLNDKWINGIRVPDLKTDYEYNEFGNIILKTTDYWLDNNWEHYTKTTYNYDDSNNLIIENKESWYNNEWKNSTICYCTYNSTNKLHTISYAYWISTLGWINTQKTTYTYDISGNTINKLVEQWVNDKWVNYFQETFTFDNNNNTIIGTHGIWESNGGYWGRVETNFYLTYNNGMDTLNVGGYDCIVEYNLFSNVDNEINNCSVFTLSQNYPNPFNPSTNISFSIPNSGLVTLKVYDILGNEITTLINEELSAGNYTKTFDATNLSSGVYFYKLNAGKFSETKKMILIR